MVWRTTTLVFVVLMACSPHKVTHSPRPPIVVPAAFQGQSDNGPLPDKWWQDFGDPVLNRLVADALAGNLQVQAAWERLRQAQAVAKQAGAGRFPEVTASASAGRQQNRNPLADFAPTTPGAPKPANTFRVNSFSASVAASYEVDFFKKHSNQASAAWLESAAARDQVEAVVVTLVAQIAEAWFGLTTQRARLEVLKRQIEVSKNFLELAEMRQRQGLGSALDVFQQRQQLAAVEAQVPLVESAIAVLENQIAALTGKAPGSQELRGTAKMPVLPPRPGAGVPADLLTRRPDVRALARRVEAADYRVAVAVANRLPGLRLTGSLGLQSTNVGDLVSTPVWNILGSLFAPIFDAGRLKAEVRRNEAQMRQFSYEYAQALLQAMVEVENAIVQESKQLEYIAALKTQDELADATLQEARSRYRDGIGDQGFLQILTALGGKQQVELMLLEARRQALSYRIQLCRALGGTWTEQLQGDKPSTDKSNAQEKRS